MFFSLINVFWLYFVFAGMNELLCLIKVAIAMLCLSNLEAMF